MAGTTHQQIAQIYSDRHGILIHCPKTLKTGSIVYLAKLSCHTNEADRQVLLVVFIRNTQQHCI